MAEPIGAIKAVGHGDETTKPQYATDIKKKNPWDEIGNALNGFGSYLNINPGNSIFTSGSNVQGAFGD